MLLKNICLTGKFRSVRIHIFDVSGMFLAGGTQQPYFILSKGLDCESQIKRSFAMVVSASSPSYPSESGFRSSFNSSMFLTMIPREIVQERILVFLTNDGQSIGRFSICCKSHYYDLLQSPPLRRTEKHPQQHQQQQHQQQQQQKQTRLLRHGSEDRCDLIWKEMIHHRWKNSKREYHSTLAVNEHETEEQENNNDENESKNNNNNNSDDNDGEDGEDGGNKSSSTFSPSRQLYVHRRSIDRFVASTVDEMTKTLFPHIQQYHQGRWRHHHHNQQHQVGQESSARIGETSNVADSSIQTVISRIYTNQIASTENYQSLLQHRGDAIDALLRIATESLKQLSPTKEDGASANTHIDMKKIGRDDPKKSPPSPPTEPPPNHCIEQEGQPDIEDSLLNRIRGFLAARLVARCHFAECLVEWECQRSQVNRMNNGGEPHDNDTGTSDDPAPSTQQRQRPERDASLQSAEHLERFVLLMNLMEQTVDDLLNRHGPRSRLGSTMDTSYVTKTLDEIANSCRERIGRLSVDGERNQNNVSVAEKVQIVNDVITQDYEFGGNEQNYYDYRNSILSHVLNTKKGIPLSLSILYVFVCRRLGIPVDVIGLPGHVVLGFYHDLESHDYDDKDHGGLRPTNRSNATTRAGSSPRRGFLDVFRGGRVLSAADCQSICNSYGVPWHDSFLEPLKVPKIIERVFNNILHCHARSTATRSRGISYAPQPRDDLALYVRVLMFFQQYPVENTWSVIESSINRLPFVHDDVLLAKFGIPT